MKRKSIAGLLLAATLLLTACGGEETKEIYLDNTQGERIPVVIDVSNPLEETPVTETEEDLSYEEEETESEAMTAEASEAWEEETESEQKEIDGAIPAAGAEKDTEKSSEKSTEKSTEKKVENETEVKTDTTAFAGRWQDNVNPQTIVDITSTGTNAFHALITRVESETQTSRWEFDGTYSETQDRMDYSGGTKKDIIKYSDGSEQTNIAYTDGTGYMQIQSNGKLYWTENKENAGANREFSKL